MASLISRTHDPVGSLSIYHTAIFARYNELEQIIQIIQSLPIHITGLRIIPTYGGVRITFREEGTGHASPMVAIAKAGLMN